MSQAKKYGKPALIFFMISVLSLGSVVVGRHFKVESLDVIFVLAGIIAMMVWIPLSITTLVAFIVEHTSLSTKVQPGSLNQLAEGMVILTLLALLAAIFIPSYLRFQGKAWNSEVPNMLRLIYTSQQSYYAKNRRFAKTFDELGFKMKGRLLYSYFLTPNQVLPGTVRGSCKTFEECQTPLKLKPYVAKDHFKIYAVSNLDSDTVLEVWSIDQDKNLVNEINDMMIGDWSQVEAGK